MPSSSDVLVAGRYRLRDKIADGGMSTVWEGWDERLHRRVAVKQLRLQAGLSEAEGRIATDRAMREARITARLHHPNAVPVYDVVDDEGSPCLIMQYLPSRTLQALLAERSTLDVAAVARIGTEVAAALAAAHQAGIVHRDVKPGNILIDEHGAAKITDFGISHALGDVNLTSTGMVTGTPAYLAPEAARGEPSSFPADVFALGATLYTALEGTPPVGNSDNPIAVLHRVASGQLQPPTRNSPLNSVLERMLALDPAARPTMPQVAGELARIARKAGASGSSVTTERLAAVPATEQMGTAQEDESSDGLPPSTTVVLPAARDSGPMAAAAAAAAPAVQRPPGNPAAQRPTVEPPVRRPPVDPPPPSADRPGRGPLIALAAVVALLLIIGFVLLGIYLTRGGSNTPAATGNSPGTGAAHSNAGHSPSSHRASSPASHSPRASHSASHSPSPSSSPSSSAPTTSNRPSSSTSPPPSSGSATTAIVNYYGLLPRDTNDAWNRLTPSYQNGQAGGRGYFNQFWGQFSAVSATNVRSVGTNAVEATISYTYRNGKQSTEVRDFQLVEDGGMLKINDSQVVG